MSPVYVYHLRVALLPPHSTREGKEIRRRSGPGEGLRLPAAPRRAPQQLADTLSSSQKRQDSATTVAPRVFNQTHLFHRTAEIKAGTVLKPSTDKGRSCRLA